jgi:hypothetical protein
MSSDVFGGFQIIERAIRVTLADVKEPLSVLGQENRDFAWLNPNLANLLPMKGRIRKGDV